MTLTEARDQAGRLRESTGCEYAVWKSVPESPGVTPFYAKRIRGRTDNVAADVRKPSGASPYHH